MTDQIIGDTNRLFEDKTVTIGIDLNISGGTLINFPRQGFDRQLSSDFAPFLTADAITDNRQGILTMSEGYGLISRGITGILVVFPHQTGISAGENLIAALLTSTVVL